MLIKKFLVRPKLQTRGFQKTWGQNMKSRRRQLDPKAQESWTETFLEEEVEHLKEAHKNLSSKSDAQISAIPKSKWKSYTKSSKIKDLLHKNFSSSSRSSTALKRSRTFPSTLYPKRSSPCATIAESCVFRQSWKIRSYCKQLNLLKLI